MNMNIDIVNRALHATGHEEWLTEYDKTGERKPLYDLCKNYYLATFLEALSEVPWVSARRRKRLMIVNRPQFNCGYRFVYTLPHDCAKPIELSTKEDWIVEGRFLCTNAVKAELLYVTNGKRVARFNAAQAPKPGEAADFVLSAGRAHESNIPNDAAFNPGKLRKPSELNASGEPDGADEDYPEYYALELEPKFHEYVEKMLAAKFAVKITDKPQLQSRLLSEALLIRDQAIKATRSMLKAKKQPDQWWADKLGLR